MTAFSYDFDMSEITPVIRDDVGRLEMMHGVTSLSQLIFPTNSILKTMSLDDLLAFTLEYVTTEDPNKHLKDYGIEKSLSSIGKALPYVIFSLREPCDSCGGHVFARKMSSRPDYRAEKNGHSYYGFTESNRFYCVDPHCRSAFSVETLKHAHHCKCRGCKPSRGFEPHVTNGPLLLTFHISPQRMNDVGLKQEHRRLLKSKISLSAKGDSSAPMLLVPLFFELMGDMLDNLSLCAVRDSSNSDVFMEVDTGKEHGRNKLFHRWDDIIAHFSGKSPHHAPQSRPCKVSTSVLVAWVRSALSTYLPDDYEMIATVSDYCMELIDSDLGWMKSHTNAKTASAIKLFSRLKYMQWNETLYRRIESEFDSDSVLPFCKKGKGSLQGPALSGPRSECSKEEKLNLAERSKPTPNQMICELAASASAFQTSILLSSSQGSDDAKGLVDQHAAELIRQIVNAAQRFGLKTKSPG